MTDLSGIKLYSEANFANVSSTDDDKLYFVEDSGGGGAITEYVSGTSGYLIFPNGMCIQWGETTGSTSGVNQNLTKTYADTNYNLQVTLNMAVSSYYMCGGTKYSASRIKIYTYSSNFPCHWMTIGQLASGQY